MSDEYWIHDYRAPYPRGRMRAGAKAFRELIDAATDEKPIQLHVQQNPWLLTVLEVHCHFVIPQMRLGTRYVCDFVIPDMTSGGTFWHLIELESPRAAFLTRSCQLRREVRKGVDQVQSWRQWFGENRDYAMKARSAGGLGLEDIAGIHATVIAGRRADVSPEFNQIRSQLNSDSHVRIITYDRWLDAIDHVVNVFEYRS